MDPESCCEYLFTSYAADKLHDHLGQVERCAALLSDEQLWYRPNAHSNSVANLLLHLRGNVSQWMLEGIGGRAYARDRQAEFDARGGHSKQDLIAGLQEAVAKAGEMIAAFAPHRLTEQVNIQGYETTVIAAMVHVVEHFAFHTGQIVTTTKWLLDVDLSLYDERGRRTDGRADGAP